MLGDGAKSDKNPEAASETLGLCKVKIGSDLLAARVVNVVTSKFR